MGANPSFFTKEQQKNERFALKTKEQITNLDYSQLALYLYFLHLPLSDLVIAVRYEVLPDLGQGQGQPRVGLGWCGKCCNLGERKC